MDSRHPGSNWGEGAFEHAGLAKPQGPKPRRAYPRTVDQAERQAMMDYLAQHPPQSREEVVAYAAYTLAGTPDILDHWLVAPAAQDAISALLADLNAKR